ncbi:putative transcription factor interactor and regulator CCHC(Zn) family [Helianthus anomalus]
MDITWQMAMAAFRAHKFAQKTGRKKWEAGFSNSASVPFTLRYYNCHEPGHVARNCTKSSVNKEQTPAQPAPPNSERLSSLQMILQQLLVEAHKVQPW